MRLAYEGGHNGGSGRGCSPLRKLAAGSKLRDGLVEERAFYLLLDAEDESLRTEINFVGDEGKFRFLRASTAEPLS